jgi:hypothetical protein
MFMENSISLVRRQGQHSFIVPDSFLLGQYFSKIRELILDQTAIINIVMILEDFWSAGNVGRSVIYTLCKDVKPNEKMNLILAETLEKFSRGEVEVNCYSQKFFEKTYLKRFRLFWGSTKEIVAKMEDQSCLLCEHVKFYSGLIGKQGQENITIHGKPSDYSPEAYGQLIHTSGNLSCYSLIYSDYYNPHNPELYKSGYDVNKYLNPKLFLNQTGDTIKACYDDRGFFCLNNMHIGYPVASHYNLKFVNSLLCSRLMNFYYHVTSLEFGRAMAQTDIETIDQLPLRQIEFTTPAEKRETSVKQAKNKAKQSIQQLTESGIIGADTAMDQALLVQATAPVLSFVQVCLSADPEQADVVHDLLTHLAEKMLGMHDQKQERIEAFWLDLEGVTDTDTFEDLREHGKWGRTLWQASEACRGFVGEESRSTRHLDESLAWNEDCFKAFVKELGNGVPNLSDIVRVYRKHHPDYSALIQRIKATDRLIDLIVYQLYGLTDEEIAIVEGRNE